MSQSIRVAAMRASPISSWRPLAAALCPNVPPTASRRKGRRPASGGFFRCRPVNPRHDLVLHSLVLAGITGREVERLDPADTGLPGDLPGRLGGQMGAL